MDCTSPHLATELRQAMRGVAASVTLVATRSASGLRHSMLASSFTSVSMEPPTVLVCIHRQTRIHAPILEAGRFCINVLHRQHVRLATDCASAHGEQRFAHAHWRLDASSGLPYVEGAQASLFCELLEQRAVGTHSVLIAHVRRVLRAAAPDVRPLLYLDGGYGAFEALPAAD